MTDHLLRRDFVLRLAATGAAFGLAPSREMFSATNAGDPFVLPTTDDDAAIFAAARQRFLFPTSVTYCNPGTLGATPPTNAPIAIQFTPAHFPRTRYRSSTSNTRLLNTQ